MSSVLSRPFLSLSLLVLSAVASLLTYLSLSDLKRAKNPLHPPTVDPTTFLGSFLGSFRVFTFLEFTASPLKMIHRCYKAYGPCFTLNMFGQRITILLSPEAQEPFFKSNDSVLSQAEVRERDIERGGGRERERVDDSMTICQTLSLSFVMRRPICLLAHAPFENLLSSLFFLHLASFPLASPLPTPCLLLLFPFSFPSLPLLLPPFLPSPSPFSVLSRCMGS